MGPYQDKLPRSGAGKGVEREAKRGKFQRRTHPKTKPRRGGGRKKKGKKIRRFLKRSCITTTRKGWKGERPGMKGMESQFEGPTRDWN